MLTNNFRKFLAHIFAPSVEIAIRENEAGGRFLLKDTNGVSCYLGISSSNAYSLNYGEAGFTDATYLLSGEAGRTLSQQSTAYRRFRIYCGTGSTEPTPDDYKLETAVDLTSVVNDTMAGGKSTNLDSYTGTVATTVRNDTAAPVTVTEIGMLLQTAAGRAMSSNTPKDGAYNNILMARELLETPIELPVGGIYTFQMTIDFSNI